MKKSDYSPGFPEKAGKQQTECLGWGVGTIHKPHHAFQSCLFGNLAFQHANHPKSKSQPQSKSVWTPLNGTFSQNIPKSSAALGQQFLTGFCHWLPRHPISSAPGSTSGTAGGKGRTFRIFQRRAVDPPVPSLSPPQELKPQPFPCPRAPAPPWLFPRGSRESSNTWNIPRLLWASQERKRCRHFPTTTLGCDH